MRRILVSLIAVILLSGCANLAPLNTGSGRPEITLCGPGKTEIMEKFVAAATQDGFNIRNTSNFQIVMCKPVKNLFLAAMAGSRYDPTPEHRVTWTFADMGNNCTHIGAVLQIVTNPGSGFERITDISTGKDAHDLQRQLDALKLHAEGLDKNQSNSPDGLASIEAWKLRRGTLGFSFSGLDNSVQAVTAGGPAQKAGLRNGDKIVKIDNFDISSLSSNKTYSMISNVSAGDRLKFVVLQDGEEKIIELVADHY